MNRVMRSMAGLLVAMAAWAGSVQAQSPTVTLGTGAGGTFPLGDFGETFGTGWNAQANIGFRSPSWPVALRFDVAYHSLNHDVPFGENDLAIIAGLANVELKFNRGSASGPFIVAGPGYYNFDREVTGGESDFGVFAGAGYKIAMTNLLVSIEGKFHNVFTEGNSSRFIPVGLVVEIPLGGMVSA
ncbi:MAG: outer membrane beta-barrel protein, partial [Longimicrobiales bacterium]